MRAFAQVRDIEFLLKNYLQMLNCVWSAELIPSAPTCVNAILFFVSIVRQITTMNALLLVSGASPIKNESRYSILHKTIL